MRTTLLALALVVAWTHAGSVTERRTGVSFPEKLGITSKLTRLGVRTKGPIKVYAVGQYEGAGGGKTFVLRMVYGVSKEKMASSLAAALKPRGCDDELVGEFENVMIKGLPNGCPKGTKLSFDTGGGGLALAVNDKGVGSVSSKLLGSAFAGIYTDGNKICAMNPVEGGGETEGGCACGFLDNLTPQRGAFLGAALGFGLGKVFGHEEEPTPQLE